MLTGDSSGTESDLEKVTRSEVGLKGIKVFKALNDAASELRQEIQSIQDWMSPDNGDWLCPIDLAPLVWNQLLNLRDLLAPSLRERLKEQYEDGYQDYAARIAEFLSAKAWNCTEEHKQEVKENLLRKFPSIQELEEYLQVVIGRPTVIPSLSDQLNSEQKECVAQVERFIQQYDANLEQSLQAAAIAAGQQLATALLEELAEWEPGYKPVQFRKRVEKHLKKVQILLANASPEAGGTLGNMMQHLEGILETASVEVKGMESSASDALSKMDALRVKLLGEQQELMNLTDQMGLSRATTKNFKFR